MKSDKDKGSFSASAPGTFIQRNTVIWQALRALRTRSIERVDEVSCAVSIVFADNKWPHIRAIILILTVRPQPQISTLITKQNLIRLFAFHPCPAAQPHTLKFTYYSHILHYDRHAKCGNNVEVPGSAYGPVAVSPSLVSSIQDSNSKGVRNSE